MDQTQNDFLQVTLDASFTDQKPGTSGLRKSTRKFQEPHYLESFIEAIFQTLPGVNGGVLVLGGDGRFGNKLAIQVILRMAAAHGISKVITTVNGILSTPAASNLIRKNNAIGGIILSASHNSGGLEGDFGVKINSSNGGPASEVLTNQIFACTQNLRNYKTVNFQEIAINSVGEFQIGSMIVPVSYTHLRAHET